MSRYKIARATWRACRREPLGYRLRALVLAVRCREICGPEIHWSP